MTAPGSILALDLSGCIGWCAGRPGAMPVFGVWHLPAGCLGARYAAAENALFDAVAVHAPGLIVMEAPLPLPAQNNALVARQQMGLAAFVESEAWRACVPVLEQDAYEVRREMLGRGRFPKGKVKFAVVAWCYAQGWRVPDHNAADACVLWAYAVRRAAHRIGRAA